MESATLTPAASAPLLAPTLDDEARARVMAAYGFDSLADDSELSAIAQFAAKLCNAPIALVNVVGAERQRFLAHEGLPVSEAPTANSSFCVHTMTQTEGMVVPDARADPRFAGNAFVTGAPFIRFYAGEPLVSEEGTPLGALCVIDTTPRPDGLTQFQREGLAVLAQATMRRLRSRRHSTAARREQEERESYLHTMADSIPAIAWSADAEGRFDYFNQRMVDFTGKPNDGNGEAFHPEDWKKASAAWQHSLATGETYEVEHRLCRHDGEYRWMMSRAVPVRNADGKIVRWFGTAVDIHDLYAASERNDLLAKELSHRIKNIFAVVSGLISLSVRKNPEHQAFGKELIGTIHALGRAHDYVRPAGRIRSNTLHGLLSDLFRPYCAGDEPCVRVTGDDTAITARAATPLALVFHELATNAAKYGALSVPGGEVMLTIDDRGETMHMTWTEHGAPPLKTAQVDGFGSRLVDLSVTGQLGGTWTRRFEPGGLVCELTLSKAALTG
ncbi:MAG: PAS domain-containing protein [Croceibacterium sp.]